MDSPQPAAAPTAHELPRTSVVHMIEELYAKRDKIRTLIIGTIDSEHAADVAWSMPPSPSSLSHLLRMMDIKLDRYYTQGMFRAPSLAGPVAGVQRQPALPRAIRREIQKAEKKVNKAQKKTMAERNAALRLIEKPSGAQS